MIVIYYHLHYQYIRFNSLSKNIVIWKTYSLVIVHASLIKYCILKHIRYYTIADPWFIIVPGAYSVLIVPKRTRNYWWSKDQLTSLNTYGLLIPFWSLWSSCAHISFFSQISYSSFGHCFPRLMTTTTLTSSSSFSIFSCFLSWPWWHWWWSKLILFFFTIVILLSLFIFTFFIYFFIKCSWLSFSFFFVLIYFL